VFVTTPFKVNEELVKNFFHAPVVSVAEVYGSPIKRRISLEGKVTEVFFSKYLTVVILS